MEDSMSKALQNTECEGLYAKDSGSTVDNAQKS